ncbi:MAG: hypothetical protein KatS3mg084_0522 [Candidatus Dojkabacteria bacterium]|nr:MAG: hypothetical protein KatS3mg084_0522 [Candidatus Dojkabacteria bacterium]
MKLSSIKGATGHKIRSSKKSKKQSIHNNYRNNIPKVSLYNLSGLFAAASKNSVLRKGTVLSVLAILVFVISFSFFFGLQKFKNIQSTGIENIDVFDLLDIGNAASHQAGNNSLGRLNQTNGKTNVLIIGVDTRSKGQSLLTDSIIVFSYDHRDNSALQISIPRDLRVRYGNGYTKINSVFSFAYSDGVMPRNTNNNDAFKKGFDELIASIHEVTGLDIHYGVMVNFLAFKEIIDVLGGIDVYVETPFTDYTYPNDYDTGVMTVSFEQGLQTMDGKRALQFVRSRHGNNGEGSDYARSKRQQIVINAIREKINKTDILSKPELIYGIVDSLLKNVRLYKVDKIVIESVVSSKNILSNTQIIGIVLDPYAGSYLGQLFKTGEMEDIGWHIYPTKGDFTNVNNYIAIINGNRGLAAEKAQVMLIYSDIKRYNDYVKMKKLFFEYYLPFEFNDYVYNIDTIVNSENDDPSGVIIYSDGQKNATLDFYKSLLDKAGIHYRIEQSSSAPRDLYKMTKEKNVVILLN